MLESFLMPGNKRVDSNLCGRTICCAATALNKSLAILVVVFAFAVAIFAPSMASAGQSSVYAKHRQTTASRHAPIEVLRDQHGDAMLTRQGEFMSSNWSGYVLPKFLTAQHYTSAQATWQVPEVIWTGALAVSANWVGIGGFCKNAKCTGVDRSLIQLGTAQESLTSSETDYFAWYELIPKVSVMTTLTVNPGDIITASLSCAGKCKGTQHWTLSMTNETTGLSWSKQVKYNSSHLSAEWIEEAPTDRSGIVPLADFGTSTFVQSMVDGASADLSTGDSIVMDDPNGQSSTVSAPDSTMDGFTACFDQPNCSFVPIP